MDYQTIKIFNEKFDEWIDTPVKRSNGRFEETPGVSFIWPQMNPVGTEYKEILSGNETGYGFVLVAVFVPLFDGELVAAAICDKIRDMFKGFVSGPIRCGKRSIGPGRAFPDWYQKNVEIEYIYQECKEDTP